MINFLLIHNDININFRSADYSTIDNFLMFFKALLCSALLNLKLQLVCDIFWNAPRMLEKSVINLSLRFENAIYPSLIRYLNKCMSTLLEISWGCSFADRLSLFNEEYEVSNKGSGEKISMWEESTPNTSTHDNYYISKNSIALLNLFQKITHSQPWYHRGLVSLER